MAEMNAFREHQAEVLRSITHTLWDAYHGDPQMSMRALLVLADELRTAAETDHGIDGTALFRNTCREVGLPLRPRGRG